MSLFNESYKHVLREGAGQRREATLIREGWGSSGYYSGEVLQRDVPKRFPAGTKMFLNHATEAENRERPEGDLRYLVGTLAETPRYAGAEMVSVAQIYPHWVPVIDAMANDIGLSIRAEGVVESGAAGGKEGQIVKEITRGISVDFVTEAGAGGKLGPLIESAVSASPPPEPELPDPELVQLAESVYDDLYSPAFTALVEAERVYLALLERDVPVAERIALAKKGQAIPIKDASGNIIGGRFPMANCADVSNAAQSIGRGNEPNDTLKSFIKRVASKLSCPVPFKEAAPQPPEIGDGLVEITEAELTELRTKGDQLAEATKQKEAAEAKAKEAAVRADRAEDALRMREAREIVAKEVATELKGLPVRAIERACNEALRDVPTSDDGKLDEVKLKAQAVTAAKAEREYLAGTTTSGQVSGMGESSSPGGAAANGKAEEELVQHFQEMGLSEAEAKIAAKGR